MAQHRKKQRPIRTTERARLEKAEEHVLPLYQDIALEFPISKWDLPSTHALSPPN
jgi:hypothetical protein